MLKTQSLDAFGAISGVGQKKQELYFDAFEQIVPAYLSP